MENEYKEIKVYDINSKVQEIRLKEIEDEVNKLENEKSKIKFFPSVKEINSVIEEEKISSKEITKSNKKISKVGEKTNWIISKVKSIPKATKFIMKQKKEEKNQLVNKINSLKENLKIVKTSHDKLKFLGFYSLEEKVDYLIEHKVQPVLQKEDKYRGERVGHKLYSEPNQLIAILKTNTPIENATIKNNFQSISDKLDLRIKSKRHVIPFEYKDNNIHFTLNGEIKYIDLSKNNFKYAILIPFEELPKNKILRILPEDTCVEDDLKLSNRAWVLCPKAELKKIRELNPTLNILGYDDTKVEGYIRALIALLGYNSESVSEDGWTSGGILLSSIKEENNYSPIKNNKTSVINAGEGNKANEAIIGLLDYLKENKIKVSEEEALKIVKQESLNHYVKGINKDLVEEIVRRGYKINSDIKSKIDILLSNIQPHELEPIKGKLEKIIAQIIATYR